MQSTRRAKSHIFWLMGAYLCASLLPTGIAAEMTFEDAQMRTVHARKAMEEKKKSLDILMQEAEQRRSVVSDLNLRLQAAEKNLNESEDRANKLEKEYESLKNTWAKEAKRLKEIHNKDRR